MIEQTSGSDFSRTHAPRAARPGMRSGGKLARELGLPRRGPETMGEESGGL